MKKIILVLLFLVMAWGAERLITLDSRVQENLTQTLSNLAGVPVSIASVDLSLLSGKGEIAGLIVANPKGYSDKNAFEMGLVSLDLDVLSALTQPLVINTLAIDKPTVNLEVRDDLQSNLQEIIGNSAKQLKSTDKGNSAEENTGQEEGSADAGSPDTKEPGAGGEVEEKEHFRITVRKLEIRDVRLVASRGLDSWEDSRPSAARTERAAPGAPQAAVAGNLADARDFMLATLASHSSPAKTAQLVEQIQQATSTLDLTRYVDDWYHIISDNPYAASIVDDLRTSLVEKLSS